MTHEYENARRHAHNTLTEANRRLDSGKTKDPREHQMLMAMIADAARTLNDLDNMDAKPYKHTDIGYNTDARRSNDAIRDAMDLVDKILPRIYNDADMRREVPGTGRGRRYEYVRDDMNNRYDDDNRYDMDDDDNMDDINNVENRRGRRRGGWRPRRTRRGVGRFTQVRTHVRRMPRRTADFDDTMDDARYDDARYDDMRYDDDRYNDARTMADHERRMNNAVARAAADAAADTAQRMVDDRRDIYPHTPVMRYDNRYDRYDRYDRRDDMRYDARDERRSDARYDTRDDRRDDADTAFDRARRPGPDMTRR